MPQLSYAIRLASYRNATEDRAVVIELPGRIVGILADGCGGVPHGGKASDAVTWLVKGRARELVDAGSCIELLREADQIVLKTGGETTAVLLVVDDEGIYGASSGDSEAWVIREDRTIDDLTAKQHKKRRLGSGRALPVGFERPAPLAGVILVGTDGLFRHARPDAIAEVVTSGGAPAEVAEALVELVRPGGSNELLDDVAVVLVRLA